MDLLFGVVSVETIFFVWGFGGQILQILNLTFQLHVQSALLHIDIQKITMCVNIKKFKCKLNKKKKDISYIAQSRKWLGPSLLFSLESVCFPHVEL